VNAEKSLRHPEVRETSVKTLGKEALSKEGGAF
jgi:hypothetical protein